MTRGVDSVSALPQSPLLAPVWGGVAGLTISASTSLSHVFCTNVIQNGQERTKGEEVLVARVAAFAVGIVSILLSIAVRNLNVAFLVGLAFAVAASANLPVIIFSLFWKRFTTQGAVWSIGTGLVSALLLTSRSPASMTVDARTVAAAPRAHMQAAERGFRRAEAARRP